jgi:hypothetical protein
VIFGSTTRERVVMLAAPPATRMVSKAAAVAQPLYRKRLRRPPRLNRKGETMYEKKSSNQELTNWKGEIPLQFIYTSGIAGEKFFNTLKNKGKILSTRCEICNITYVPARIFCEKCFAPLENYRELPNRATLYSWTKTSVDMDGRPLARPQLVGIMEFEGGAKMVHKLGDIDEKKISIGMPLEPVFKEKSKREGSILDIKYFRPKK